MLKIENLTKKYGEKKAKILFTQNPYKIIEDEPISIEHPIKYEKPKGLFSKIFKR